MRKLRRSVARYNMKKEGITRINKDTGSGSFFKNNWVEYSEK